MSIFFLLKEANLFKNWVTRCNVKPFVLKIAYGRFFGKKKFNTNFSPKITSVTLNGNQNIRGLTLIISVLSSIYTQTLNDGEPLQNHNVMYKLYTLKLLNQKIEASTKKSYCFFVEIF